MRQYGASLEQAGGTRTSGRTAALLFVLWLALSPLAIAPASTIAAPPVRDTAQAPKSPSDQPQKPDANEDARSAVDRVTDKVDEGSKDDADAVKPARSWGGLDFGSIRRRGLEAPVQLRQKEQEAEPADDVEDGDGDLRESRAASGGKEQKDVRAEKAQQADSRQQRGIRVWPMRADSYTFTQAFGCTQQIANFYLPDAGCPASAPVVHSGIDLAAPEGTLFYAAASGWVTGAGYDREVGVPNTRIIIQHDGRNEGFATEYLHWIASYVDEGDYVEAGDAIGEVGSVGYSTGPHLHFSLVDLDSGEHSDPLRWLPKEPGTEGYRGRRPNTRAAMRLPAGTTAGLPESADPAPPPPPVRQEVPESPAEEDDGKDTSSRKKKRDREERRAAKSDSTADNQSDNAADAEDDEPAPKARADDSDVEGKNKERTRKRERDKDGRSSEKSESGENGDDGGKRKSNDKKDDSADKPNNDNRGGRRDSSEDDKDRQHKNNDNQGNNDKQKDKKNGGGGKNNGADDDSGTGDDGADGSAGDEGGDGTGADEEPIDDDGTDDNGDENSGNEDKIQDKGDSENSDAPTDSKDADSDANSDVSAAQDAEDQDSAAAVDKPKRNNND